MNFKDISSHEVNRKNILTATIKLLNDSRIKFTLNLYIILTKGTYSVYCIAQLHQHIVTLKTFSKIFNLLYLKIKLYLS